MFMTLLTALAVQWTGNQQIVFIAAGVMHPLSLLIFYLWLNGKFDQVDISTGVRMGEVHRPLVISGAIVTVLGAALITLITNNWALCVEAATLSGAVTAVTAAAGVALIGLTLVYAGLPKKRFATTVA
jgi:ACS family hexuronate transporter-like MFS transporter